MKKILFLVLYGVIQHSVIAVISLRPERKKDSVNTEYSAESAIESNMNSKSRTITPQQLTCRDVLGNEKVPRLLSEDINILYEMMLPLCTGEIAMQLLIKDLKKSPEDFRTELNFLQEALFYFLHPCKYLAQLTQYKTDPQNFDSTEYEIEAYQYDEDKDQVDSPEALEGLSDHVVNIVTQNVPKKNNTLRDKKDSLSCDDILRKENTLYIEGEYVMGLLSHMRILCTAEKNFKLIMKQMAKNNEIEALNALKQKIKNLQSLLASFFYIVNASKNLGKDDNFKQYLMDKRNEYTLEERSQEPLVDISASEDI